MILHALALTLKRQARTATPRPMNSRMVSHTSA